MDSESVGSFQSGQWSGEYLDAAGHRANIRLQLEASGSRIVGKAEFAFRDEDKPRVVEARVSGEIVGVDVVLRWGEGEEAGVYRGRLSAAGSFARQAIFGIAEAPVGTNLGGGVWIAWRFAERDAARR